MITAVYDLTKIRCDSCDVPFTAPPIAGRHGWRLAMWGAWLH